MLPIKKTANPPAQRSIKMSCDKPLSNNIPRPLPQQCFRMLVIGAPGSGKTSLATSLLLKGGAYYRVFDRIFIIQPPNSRASYASDPWKGHNRVYDELTAPVLEEILEEVSALAADDKHSLIFIDDQAMHLKDKHIEKQLRLAFFNARHLHLSSIIVSQTLRSVGDKLRKSASHLLTFEPANRVEAKIIAEEFLFLDTKTAATLFQQVFTEKYAHLLIDTAQRRVYGNWDEITLPKSWD